MQEPQQHTEQSFLPKAGSRAQSMINNSRPPQQHRTIKDRSNSIMVVNSASEKRPALVPISNVDNVRGSFESCLQGGPAGLLKMDKPNSASENDTKDHLRRRIKDLEKEVIKLTSHTQQAEQAIKNYRVSLSEKSPRVGSNNKDCGAQTDPDDTVKIQASFKAVQDKLTATTEELRSLRDVKDSLFNERKQLQETNRRKEEYLLVSIQANEETISQLRARVRELEEEKIQGAQSSADATPAQRPQQQEDIGMLEKMLEELTLVQKLKDDVIGLKKKAEADQISMHAALQADYHAILCKAQQEREAAAHFHQQTLLASDLEHTSLQTELTGVRSELTAALGEINCLSEQVQALQLAHLTAALAPAVKEFSIATTNTDTPVPVVYLSTSTSTSAPSSPVRALHSPVKTPIKIETTFVAPKQHQDVNLSPFSPMLSRTSKESAAAAIQADLQIQTKLRLAEKDAEIDQLQKQLARDRLHLSSQSDDLMNLRSLMLSERERFDQICSEQEARLAQRTTQCMNERLRVESIQQRLSSAHQAMGSLQEVHAAEVKAVKHEAHVKDLLRVAKEREAVLEKERLQIEIKHIKEIQSILTFSLSTAEQSLNEVQPHVVVKLVQGREKRLKLLEQSTNGRRKDLDQRSVDTCAVNSAHLEGFQKKAAANNNIAKEMTHAATKKLLSLLGDSGANVDGESGGGGGATGLGKTGTGSSSKF